MTKLQPRCTVALLVLLHVCLSFADLQHVDAFLAAGNEHSVARHDCGPQEHHGNLDGAHFCVPCYRHVAGIVSLNLLRIPLPPPVVRFASMSPCDRLYAGFFPETYHRGPPSLSPAS